MLAILKTIKRYLTLEWLFIKYCLLREMEFRFNFLVSFLTVIVVHTTNILTYSVIFLSVDNIGGWNFPEITFLIGTSALIDGVFMSCIFFNLTQLPNMINNGELDFLLLKPVNSMFMVSFRRFNLGTFIGNIPVGIAMIFFALTNIEQSLSIAYLPVYFAMIVNGIIIIYSLFFIVKCLAFYFIRIDGLDQVFWTVYEFGRRVPGTIYSTVMRAIFTFALPVLVVVFFPSGLMLKKLGMQEIIISFCMATILLLLTVMMWNASIKKYNSASS